MNNGIKELETTARRIRSKVIELSCHRRTPHIGSTLSCVDILVAAYWCAVKIDSSNPACPDRDRFILSKGHAATALYVTLWMRGFFGEDVLHSYTLPGGLLPEHPVLGSVPGIEATSGSLGHGLPIGLGMALAGKIHGRTYRVYVLMSDGECNEGSVWEAAMLAPAHKLENLVAIVDFNRWQATGRSVEITSICPLREKFMSFGWSAYDVDGHNLDAVAEVLKNVPDGSGKPVAVIAHTIKGKGISFMEDNNDWHYRIPTAEEHRLCIEELRPE